MMPCHYCGASAAGSTPIIEMTGHVRPGCCAAAPRAAPGGGLPPGYAPVSPGRGVPLFAVELAGSGTAAILAARGAGPVTMLGAPSDAGGGWRAAACRLVGVAAPVHRDGGGA